MGSHTFEDECGECGHPCLWIEDDDGVRQLECPECGFDTRSDKVRQIDDIFSNDDKIDEVARVIKTFTDGEKAEVMKQLFGIELKGIKND